MFGLLKSASCGLSGEGHREWWQHICGVCLALHRNVGQVGRLTTNYDSALLSLLVSQQMADPTPLKQGVCVLRRPVRANTVAPTSMGAQFGGAMGLIMGSIKLKDQLADGDIGRLSPMNLPAQAAATKWEQQGTALAHKLGFKAETLFQLAQSQLTLESQPNLPFGTYARPTEQAVGLAFAHTAVLAERPQNVPLMQQMGEAYGRLMLLLDSYKDFKEDVEQNKFNALAQTHDADSYESAARTLWRDAHTTLTQTVLELNGSHKPLSTTLLTKQLNRIGERALKMSHVCAVCSTDQASQELYKEKQNAKEEPNDAGDCVDGCCQSGCFCGSQFCSDLCCDCCCESCCVCNC